jgi:superfamily I DNA/RNA helicase
MELSGTYRIIGPPGCGKTERAKRAVRNIVADYGSSVPITATNCPVAICSLTNTAANEIAGRDLGIPKQAVGTLHAHARRIGERKEIAESQIEDWNAAHPSWKLPPMSRDADEMTEQGGAQPGFAVGLYEAMHLERNRMTPRESWPATVRNFAAKWDLWKKERGFVDFTDMVEDALRSAEADPAARPCNCQSVIMDEAQDFSRLELSLALAWGRAAGSTIALGDPFQCLFGWRGADPDFLLENFGEQGRDTVLKQSWRVPEKIVKVSMALARRMSNFKPIEYNPTEVEGRIRRSRATWRSPEALLRFIQDRIGAGESVMLAATCGYMVAPAVAMLRKAGIPFSNPWRPTRGDWNPLARRGTPFWQRALDFVACDPLVEQGRPSWTIAELRHWVEPMKVAGTLTRGAKKHIAELNYPEGEFVRPEYWEPLFTPEALGELKAIWEAREGGDFKETDAFARWWTSRLLPAERKKAEFPAKIIKERGAAALADEPRVFVGSVHSFKGAQAKHVVLFPDLSRAGMLEWIGGPRKKDAILRTLYVGMTRAEESLTVCQPASQQFVDLKPFLV